MSEEKTAKNAAVKAAPGKPRSGGEQRREPLLSVVGGGAGAAKARPAYSKKTIALIYDFDGTLCPRPMQEYAFLPKIGEDPQAFWRESNRKAKAEGADPLITYMHLMYKKAKERGIRIDRDALVAQGAAVEFFPGVMQWFDEITA